jgi:aquaporin NIP
LNKRYVVEFIATFIMVFAGCGAIVVETLTGALGHAGVALTWGFVVVALIYTFGHISGAHMNPAVTISFTMMKEFERKDLFFYVFAQVLGAIVASGILYLIFFEDANSMKELAYLGATLPRGSNIQLFVMEFILTFILMLVICGSAVHGKAIKSFAGLAIGLTVGLEAMFAGPITMASMNPARSLGPALVSGNLDVVWIYVVATVSGALMAGFVFVKVIHAKDIEDLRGKENE